MPHLKSMYELIDWLIEQQLEPLMPSETFMSKAKENEVGILAGKLSLDQLKFLTSVSEVEYIESRYDQGESVLIIGL